MPTEGIFQDVADAGERYDILENIGSGVFGRVYSAKDTEANKTVAVKIQRVDDENLRYVKREYEVLQHFSDHANIVDFYGVFNKGSDEIWFVMELCEAGTVMDLVNGLLIKNRRMAEEHIAYVLKETVKGLTHLHEKNIIHRDVQGNNILLTKDGEVKLTDFGLCIQLADENERCSVCTGSPYWMAPEVVLTKQENVEGYGIRADVWSLGITAIELGDGKAPFQHMHPSRALFQISRNPPPTLYRPANWSETYNDFIDECLSKNPDHRPHIMELPEHTFLQTVPENCYHLTQEIKSLSHEYSKYGKEHRQQECFIPDSHHIKVSIDEPKKILLAEDLAALDVVNDESILKEIKLRLKEREFQTFLGDILIILNPYDKPGIYTDLHHAKYKFKCRSENAPHIFAVADASYQHALHHNTIQQILFTGETGSGKTTNYLHGVDHLLYLGESSNFNNNLIKNAIKLMHSLVHASTPHNDYSTRSLVRTEITYGRTAKVSGALFGVRLLEKWRISYDDPSQANFHILYYFYDGLADRGELEKYSLDPHRSYKYLRTNGEKNTISPRCDIDGNVKKFDIIREILVDFDFTEEQRDTIFACLAAILILGQIEYEEEEEGSGKVTNEEEVEKVAQLLNLDGKKFKWTLTNYCFVEQGVAVKRKHSLAEAKCARDFLANNIYSRLVDYIISVINHKLSYGRVIFGEHYTVRITDIPGFECFRTNRLPQLFINCLNEQLQYFYSQKVFAWESMELTEEQVEFTPFRYYDNKLTLESILTKPHDLITLIDDASKNRQDGQYITDNLNSKTSSNLEVLNKHEFSIAHYTGRVVYDTKEMPQRNRDFLPPEIIEVMRNSQNAIVKTLFTSRLDKMGNLYVTFDEKPTINKRRFISSSSSDEEKPNQQFSQIKRMRTASTAFRATSLDLLKELSIGKTSGTTHFVRCLRSNLENKPWNFNDEIVKQQLKAMAITETVKERQRGYPYIMTFEEFLERYKFLAFDFDENVDVTRENCRLLLVRLKMEGWLVGKSKVFLKYYHEEYLSYSYENKVKKVVKIQSIIRSYLVKKRLSRKNNVEVTIAFRDLSSRNALRTDPYDDLEMDTKEFIRFYCKKWKAKSIFQILLMYRAARYQDLFNLSQQVHFYNQNTVFGLQKVNTCIDLDWVDSKAQCALWLGNIKPSVLKMPFRLDEIPYYNTSYYVSEALIKTSARVKEEESWDSPFKWRTSSSQEPDQPDLPKPPTSNQLADIPYVRDPDKDIPNLPLSPTKKQPCYCPSQVDSKSPPKPPRHKPHNAEPDNELEEMMNYRNRQVSEGSNNGTTSPANKDFEFIKPPSVSARMQADSANPVAELEKIGRSESVRSEDDPPFNFQKMLRKTNYQRNSLRRSGVEKVPESGYASVRKDFKSIDNRQTDIKKFSGELAPGLFIEGIIADV